MTEQNGDNTSFDRRKVLALAGMSSAGLLGTVSFIHTRSRTDQTGREQDDAERTSDGSNEGTNTDVERAPSIEEFGAIRDEDTRQIARRNREAIKAAAQEAGSSGTVYVPEGNYYFGDTGTANQLQFGTVEPAGVSLEGEGPHKSSLIFTETVDPDASYRAFRYDESDSSGETMDHGEVTIRNLCLDGNYNQLEINDGRTVWGINAYGEGNFTLENVWIRNWWANGTRFADASVDIRGCRFEENGIGQAQVSGEQSSAHHISARPAAGNTITIEDSTFLRCSGVVINRPHGDGELILRRALIRGVGLACFKLSNTEGKTRVENSYYNPGTQWMARNLPTEFRMDGRWFLYRVRGEEYTPTVVLDNVVATGLSRSFVTCFDNVGINLKGDMISVHDAATSSDHDQALRADTGINFDVERISVHGTGGTVFDAPESTGVIKKLRRRGNRGLGEVGDVSVGDNPETDPLQPDIVRRPDVGLAFPGSR